jgi:hypothetical protein
MKSMRLQYKKKAFEHTVGLLSLNKLWAKLRENLEYLVRGQGRLCKHSLSIVIDFVDIFADSDDWLGVLGKDDPFKWWWW